MGGCGRLGGNLKIGTKMSKGFRIEITGLQLSNQWEGIGLLMAERIVISSVCAEGCSNGKVSVRKDDHPVNKSSL